MLIVLGGLPGTGKTTLARALARRRGALWLRIDTVEQAIRRSGDVAATVGIAGYAVAQALAVDNLSCGRTVVADAVNPVAASRQGWQAVAAEAHARMVAIHVVCSDAALHRRRLETRPADVPGLVLPGWDDVLGREFEPWPEAQLMVDTAWCGPEEAVDAIDGALERLAATPS